MIVWVEQDAQTIVTDRPNQTPIIAFFIFFLFDKQDCRQSDSDDLRNHNNQP